ncbi:alpha/beta hydrolase [Rhizobium binae]|uniref:alpha/beta hydrolase n=1 Tax=Rhizobium binae TaxID=1138190 RepID=UPI001C82F3AC|nr:alpha/beta hydrolase [Rhizobium binae]MBX4938627.1 alpha/beta hydrolase [Rhizobium binae]MBX4943873.1 alpha/beta hydrolase [Rhizobium binae]MBX4951063.1 alpha/beta hydrolase [Rhizobium binae]MBX4964193.1 alpha/beta hydrolase [Rhizobium binae]MBX4979044.1 alpha/beta hydrolase [Rhizobium binae]
MSTTRYLLLLPLMAAIAYMAVVALVYFSQRSLLYPGAGATPAAERAAWGEAVHVKTPDGELLQGLYSEGDSDKPCVLLFFGNGDRVDNYAFLARALAARSIGLLAISYRGYPGSTGSPGEQGLLTDGIAAFDWLSAQAGSGIVVLGRSLGTGVAVNTAANRPAVGVILVSPYLSALSVAQTRYPFLPVELLLKDPFRSDLKIGKLGQPKLFLHGRLDDSIPLSSGEALFRLAPEPKRMVIYDGAGHNDILNDRMVGDVIGFVEALTDNRPRNPVTDGTQSEGEVQRSLTGSASNP